MPQLCFTFLPLVPVRANASDKAEIVTQLLFGDIVEALDQDRQWMHVRNLADGYEGWVDEKSIFPVDKRWMDAITSWEFMMLPSTRSAIKRGNQRLSLHLSLGSRVPFTGPLTKQEVFSPTGLSLEIDPDACAPASTYTADEVVRASEHYLGAPYLWGGKSLWGIDCSGLTQMVFALCGRNIPRDARQQAQVGTEVSFSDMLPGDLAFFDNSAGKIVHVGIVLEGGRLRHAHGFVHDDQLKIDGIYSEYTQKQTHTLCSIRRIP